jgi:hypothetical protein
LRDHEERFAATSGIRLALGPDVAVLVLDEPTASQSETVAVALERLLPTGSFLVKDSDNFFVVAAEGQEENFVAVDSLNNHDLINPRNKSYLEVDHNGLVMNIREKEVIGDLFSVGGYCFSDAPVFLEHFKELSRPALEADGEMFLSDVISSMILHGIPFGTRQVSGYQDWGTVHEWRRSLRRARTLLVALDGFVFERGSNYFRPRFEDVAPNAMAVLALCVAVADGQDVRYLSIRPSSLADLTRRQLLDCGAPEGDVVFGLPPTGWELVTAPHPTLPIRTGGALEIEPDDPNLGPKLRDDGPT